MQNGYIGWVPVKARVGDVVGLFAGCRIPYVLRVFGDWDEYMMVGSAYVHGGMEGEGEVDGVERAEVRIR